MTENPIEIPQQMRDQIQQNIKRAHAAYEQLADFLAKAVDVRMDAMPASPMDTGFKHVKDHAMEIAMENSESVLTFAGKISNAQTFPDIATLQMLFVQDRMKAFTMQTQELYKLIGETVEILQGG